MSHTRTIEFTQRHGLYHFSGFRISSDSVGEVISFVPCHSSVGTKPFSKDVFGGKLPLRAAKNAVRRRFVRRSHDGNFPKRRIAHAALKRSSGSARLMVDQSLAFRAFDCG